MYVRVARAEERTLGGVLLPGSSQQRPTSGQVISLGDGRLPDGKTMEFSVKPGDEVRSEAHHAGVLVRTLVALTNSRKQQKIQTVLLENNSDN